MIDREEDYTCEDICLRKLDYGYFRACNLSFYDSNGFYYPSTLVIDNALDEYLA